MIKQNKIGDLYLSLLIELRKEVIESQKIRAQVIGFKITFVSAGIAVIIANLEKLPPMLLAIPAFAAIFFDFLIDSYSFSIKRIGNYCLNYLEPYIHEHFRLDESFLLWEQFMHKPEAGQIFAIVGNLGLTSLVVVPGIIGLVRPYRLEVSLPLLIVLGLLFSFDIYSFWYIRRMREAGLEKTESSSNIAISGEAPSKRREVGDEAC